MKKLSFVKQSKLILFFLFTIIISGCKSLPETNIVNAIDLLDCNSEVYFAIPTQADPEFIQYFLISNIQGLSEKDTQQIINRIDTIYCGIVHEKNYYTVNASIKESIPANYVNKMLSKNKAFNTQKFKIDNGKEYLIHNYQNIKLSFPSNELALIGNDLGSVLNEYENIKSTGLVSEQSIKNNEEIYNYLNTAVEEIKFFSEKPKAFLSILIGNQMDLRLKNVFGSFKTDPKHNKQYLVELHFTFKNEKFLKAGKTLLSLAFGLTGGSVNVLENNELVVTGIELNKEQLYKLLVL